MPSLSSDLNTSGVYKKVAKLFKLPRCTSIFIHKIESIELNTTFGEAHNIMFPDASYDFFPRILSYIRKIEREIMALENLKSVLLNYFTAYSETGEKRNSEAYRLHIIYPLSRSRTGWKHPIAIDRFLIYNKKNDAVSKKNAYHVYLLFSSTKGSLLNRRRF